MNKIANIVIVNDFDYIQGGASKVAIQTANILSEKGYKVYFFSGATINDDSLNKNIIRVCTNQGEALKDKNRIRGVINGIYNFKVKKEFKKLLLTLDKDKTIIHIHGWTKVLSSSAFDIADKLGFSVVTTLHDYFSACPNGGYFNYKKNELCTYKPLSLKCISCNCDSRNYFFKMYRIIRQFVQNKVVKLNDRLKNVITISNFSEEILKKTLNKNVSIYRVYNPVDKDNGKYDIDLNKNDYYIYVGRLSKEKGADLFCQAISNVGLKGVVVGDGDQLEILKRDYPSIEFVGWKSPEEVKKYMRGAKALVVPSKCYEAAPLTPLEAMQFGIPCISIYSCAASDYINEKTGCLFNPKGENTLEKVLLNFEKKDLNKLKKSCLNYYNNLNYDYARDIIKCYERVIKK